MGLLWTMDKKLTKSRFKRADLPFPPKRSLPFFELKIQRFRAYFCVQMFGIETLTGTKFLTSLYCSPTLKNLFGISEKGKIWYESHNLIRFANIEAITGCRLA